MSDEMNRLDETAGGAETPRAVKRGVAALMRTTVRDRHDSRTYHERIAHNVLAAALDAVDWPDTLAGHMTITLTDMHRCACHAPLAPSVDRYMAEQAHLTHLSAIIRAALLGGDQ